MGVCAPHGWNLTEISVRCQTQSSQGKFDAGLPRSAKFSKGSPVTGSSWEASARLLTDWDSAPEDPFPSFRTSRGSHPAVGVGVPTEILKSNPGGPDVVGPGNGSNTA